jgi:ASC-1-like (ASCH) protein
LYSLEEIERDHKVVNEVICSVLAQQLDLSVPEPALFEFNELFLQTLNDEARHTLINKDERVKFGCKYIEGAQLFTSELGKEFLNKTTPMDSIFAFDNFVLNADRNHRKPNILLKKDEYYLIDHEFGLNVSEKRMEDFKNRQVQMPYHHHIFYSYLKSERDSAKRYHFDTFVELLRNLDIEKLNPYFIQLEEYQHLVNHRLIKEYFYNVKAESDKFATILKGFLV